MIEQTDRELPHLEGFANVEKVGILGERVTKHAQLQRQLVRDPTHFIHPEFAFPFLKNPSDILPSGWVGLRGLLPTQEQQRFKMERPLTLRSDWLSELRRQTGRVDWRRQRGEPIRLKVLGNIQFGRPRLQVKNTITGQHFTMVSHHGANRSLHWPRQAHVFPPLKYVWV